MGTLAEGSLLLAGGFRERQGHRTIVAAGSNGQHKGSAMRAGRFGTEITAL